MRFRFRHRVTWLAAGFVLCAPVFACQQGRVFVDGNGDGIAQAAEPGVAQAQVSNGSEIVSTDASGAWHGLAVPDDGQVFLIKPPGYDIARGRDGLPGFWRHAVGPGPRASADCDFALTRAPGGGGPLKIIVTSDPQAGTPREVRDYARIVDGSLAAHRNAALGLTLGDVANDDLSLYPGLIAATASLGVPWLHLPGNHDLDANARDDAGSLHGYRAAFGPDTYAWEEREVVVVMLDNVIAQPGQRPAYVGGLREAQFAFLERYLSQLDGERLLVVAAHIPWFDTAGAGKPPTVRADDRARLFRLLERFRSVLLLSGHRHAQRRHFHGADGGWAGETPLQEYNVGAMSGAYWSGVDDARGIPVSTMADGTPRGFAILQVSGDGAYRLAWHPTIVSPPDPAVTDAMALHAPRVLRRGAYPAWAVFANVFMGHDGTRVEYRVGDGAWKAMDKRLAPDPRLLAENARDDASATLRSFDRSPEAEPSPHLWRGALATDLPAGEHRVEVRAFDDHGGEHRAWTVYRLEDATR